MVYNPYQMFNEFQNPEARYVTTSEPITRTETEEPTTSTTRSVVEGMSPEEINAAYEGTYGTILRNPNAFRISPEAAADFYNRLETKLTGEGMESIGGELAARGYAPVGGTFGQLYGQLRSDIGLKRAGAELGLEQGAQERRAALATQGAAAQYAALVGRRRTTTQDVTTRPGARTITTSPQTQTQLRYGPSGFGGVVQQGRIWPTNWGGTSGLEGRLPAQGIVQPAAVPSMLPPLTGDLSGIGYYPRIISPEETQSAYGPNNPYAYINPLLPNERT